MAGAWACLRPATRAPPRPGDAMPRDGDTADGGARGGTGRANGATPVGSQRRSRITEARGYHPRGRTVGDPASGRPALRLVTATDEAVPARRRAGSDDGVGATRRTTTRSSTRDSAQRTFGDIAPPKPGSRSQAARAANQAARAGGAATLAARAGGAATLAAHAGSAGSARTAGVRAGAATSAARRRPAAVAPIRRVSTRVVIPPLANQHRRLRAGLALVLVVFVVLCARLVQFQFADGARYAAAGQAVRLPAVPL